jgi:hypothetical protein
MEKETIEKKIISLLNSKNLTKMGFAHNVEIESEFDEDGDEIVTIVDAVEITPDGLIAYDVIDIDEDGNADPVWKVSELPEETQKDILWALETQPWDVWNWENYKF